MGRECLDRRFSTLLWIVRYRFSQLEFFREGFQPFNWFTKIIYETRKTLTPQRSSRRHETRRNFNHRVVHPVCDCLRSGYWKNCDGVDYEIGIMTEKELRELDSRISEHVFGLTYSNFNFCDSKTGAFVRCDLPHYTTDPAAAMRVLERCAENLYAMGDSERVQILGSPGDGWVVFASDSKGKTWEADSMSLPLSVCLFAKKLFEK